jgi:hypothetical protein
VIVTHNMLIRRLYSVMVSAYPESRNAFTLADSLDEACTIILERRKA